MSKKNQSPDTSSSAQDPSQRSLNSPSKDFGHSSSKRNGPIQLIFSVFTLCLMILAAIYAYESWRNNHVLDLKAQAENAAFNKNWAEAEEKLQNASQMRPELQGVSNSLQAVRQAKRLDRQLSTLSQQLKNDELDQAAAEMDAITEMLRTGENELYFLFKDELIDIREEILIKDVLREIKDPLSMESLARKLLDISDIEGESAQAAREQVRDKIAEAAILNAQEKLDNTQFSEALNIMEIALGYTPNHDELIAFQQKIKDERLAYQTAEYDRMQKAMEEAKAEDQFNRTEAVSITDWEVNNPQSGVFELQGEIINKGSRPISWVEITWGLYEENGGLVEESVVVVDPEYIPQDGKGKFLDTIEFSGYSGKVEITNITWYLE